MNCDVWALWYGKEGVLGKEHRAKPLKLPRVLKPKRPIQEPRIRDIEEKVKRLEGGT